MSVSRQEVAELLEQIFKAVDYHSAYLSILDECQALREAGQKEYAHDESNAFGNFERTGSELFLVREKVLWIFLKKHLDGILAYINGHRSQREDVRGRINDSIVYLILLRAMVEDDEQTFEHGDPR